MQKLITALGSECSAYSGMITPSPGFKEYHLKGDIKNVGVRGWEGILCSRDDLGFIPTNSKQ